MTAAAEVSDSGYTIACLLQQDRQILFFHSSDVLSVLVRAVTVQGRTDAQEELERVAEIVAVVAIERIGAVVDGELGAETNVDAVAVRQVADVTERVPAHWKNFGFIGRR